VKGSRIIGAYHTRRAAPLMSRALSLYLMTLGASLEGTALADGALLFYVCTMNPHMIDGLQLKCVFN